MPPLTPEGQRLMAALAQRHGVSVGAVVTLLHALIEANGGMAQFDHPELGGAGQWMRGGMTMVGDMFNNALKAKVDSLCSELSELLAKEPFLSGPPRRQSQAQFQGSYSGAGETSLFVSAPPSGQWWPEELGTPTSAGSQNNIRYAFFPEAQRLAIEIDGRLTLYDTLDHEISGVSQQQSRGASLTFISQRGLVRVSELPVVTAANERSGVGPAHVSEPEPTASSGRREPTPPVPAPEQSEDVFTKIERLAELKQKGILSEEEFATKKAELLARL